jgi:ribonuclease R
MILANVAAAETLEQRHMPCMYRIHDKPDPLKLDSLRQFLGSLGIGLPPGLNLRPKDFARALEKASGSPYERLVSETILRGQSQAIYSPDNIGHFGLALRRYAHFTSPIRRYADLLVHRGLIAALRLGEGGLAHAEGGSFAEMGEHISQCERRAVAAERAAMDRYMAAYMSERVGASFEARISGVTRFGLFVALDESGAQGLIPIKTLGAEYFRHDEPGQALVGGRSGTTYRLGDALVVKLRDCDVATGSLVFELIEKTGGAPSLRPAPRSTDARRAPRRPAANRPGKPPQIKRGRRR